MHPAKNWIFRRLNNLQKQLLNRQPLNVKDSISAQRLRSKSSRYLDGVDGSGEGESNSPTGRCFGEGKTKCFGRIERRLVIRLEDESAPSGWHDRGIHAPALVVVRATTALCSIVIEYDVMCLWNPSGLVGTDRISTLRDLHISHIATCDVKRKVYSLNNSNFLNANSLHLCQSFH